MESKEFWKLIGLAVAHYQAQDPDWMDALNHAITDMTDLMLIKKETWDNYLDMLSEDESSAPVTVIVSRNRDGGVTAIKPDHVEVEYRDYKVGSDCHLCGRFNLHTRMRQLTHGPANSTITAKSVKVCPDCFDGRARDLFVNKEHAP